jgi:Autographiviridae endonuclease
VDPNGGSAVTYNQHMKPQRTLRNTPEKIWSKIDVRGPDDCWNWKGRVNAHGYGQPMFQRRLSMAHRIVYFWTYPGEIEIEAPQSSLEKGFVLHKCDNRLCCNPRHLFVGTKDDNMKDMAAKSRGHRFARGKHPNCQLTAQDVERIREASLFGAFRKDLVSAYGVSTSIIKNVKSGKTYVGRLCPS